jgi:hypothetical protein
MVRWMLSTAGAPAPKLRAPRVRRHEGDAGRPPDAQALSGSMSVDASYPDPMGMNTHRVRSSSYGLGVTDRALLAKLRPGPYEGPFADLVDQLGHPATRVLMSMIKLSERGLISSGGQVDADVKLQLVRAEAKQRRRA